MIDKPLYGNPLAGGLPLTLESADPNNLMPGTSPPTGGTLNGVSTISNANFNPTPPSALQPLTYEQAVGLNANKAVKSPETMKAIAEAMKKGPTKLDPQANMPDVLGPQIIDNFKPKSDDPIMQGYLDSEFFSNIMTADSVPYTYDGKEMTGSSSGASNLKKYLESIGKGDLLQFKNNDVMSQDLLGKVNPDDPADLGSTGGPSLFPFPGMDSTEIATASPVQPEFSDTGIFNSPSETTGQYLTGPNESANVLETLKNIEQGIASLGQGGMNQSSFGGFNNNFGIGSFFPPYGGMYG